MGTEINFIQASRKIYNDVQDNDTPIIAGMADTAQRSIIREKSVAAGGDEVLATKTLTFAYDSIATVYAFAFMLADTLNALKLRLYMDGVLKTESTFLGEGGTPTAVIVLEATGALKGVGKVCYLSVHNYAVGAVKYRLFESGANNQGIGIGIAIGSIKLT